MADIVNGSTTRTTKSRGPSSGPRGGNDGRGRRGRRTKRRKRPRLKALLLLEDSLSGDVVKLSIGESGPKATVSAATLSE